MPQAVAVAAIGAAGTLAGAGVAAHSAGRATRAQQSASEKAIAFERERETYRRQQFEQAQARAEQAHAAQERIRLAFMRRYGAPVPMGGGAPGGARAHAGLTLGTLAGPRPVRPTQTAPKAGLTLAEMADWSGSAWRG